MLQNGLTIPLLSQFIHYDGNENNISNQDCELTDFKRICKKLKLYFKRQNIILCLDKRYANEAVLKEINDRKWKYIIVFPLDKLITIDRQLKEQQANKVFISG